MTILQQIFTLTTPPGERRGLKQMQELILRFDSPQQEYPCIHIAGSNGKGSVATKIAGALQASGLKVGLYTSPHLHSFCERIAINGTPISEICAENGVQEILDTKLEPTFFEIATLLAFLTFKREQVDVAVIEAGLGGRLDATNVITPILSVITSISKEHSHLLGEDLETIAREKAGILKPGIPVVLGPCARQQAIRERATFLQCPVVSVDQSFFHYDEENRAIALQCLMVLGKRYPMTFEQIEQGLNMRPSCRMEQRGRIIYDVAHNPDACARLVQALGHSYPNTKFRFLVGFCKDKEIDACLRLLAPAATHFHLVQAGSSRAALVHALAKAVPNSVPYTCYESIEEGMKEAHLLGRNQANELLVITGSFYLMDEVMRLSALEAGLIY